MDRSVELFINGDKQQALDILRTLPKNDHHHYNSQFYQETLSKELETKRTLAIVGYKSMGGKCWDPNICKEEGLPGSEECVVYLAEALSKEWIVHVYMNPPDSEWTLPTSNPRYYDCNDYYSSEYNYDYCLAWRVANFHQLKTRAKKVLFWPHDIPSFQFEVEGLDGILYLSHYEKQCYEQFIPALSKISSTIIGNGIKCDQFTVIDKVPQSCGYFSNYSRGLLQLLRLWPAILKQHPKASLAIAYGREHWGTMNTADYKECIQLITTLPNIKEYGKINHQELATLMGRTAIWLYPCNTLAETFCITAIKCQMAGMACCVIPVGALHETVNPSNELCADLNQFYEKTLLLLGQELEIRTENIEFAKQYDWSCVAQKLVTYLKQ